MSLYFDANEPLRLARFWAEALRWNVADEASGEIGLLPTDGTSFGILFLPVPGQKPGQNRLHLDLTTTSIEDQQETVRSLIELGSPVLECLPYELWVDRSPRHIRAASAREP